eukprot:7981557-Pyramimonas_sp.AAC.1
MVVAAGGAEAVRAGGDAGATPLPVRRGERIAAAFPRARLLALVGGAHRRARLALPCGGPAGGALRVQAGAK